MNILSALKSRGEFEVSRTIGGVGAFAYVVCANAFVAWSISKGEHFDLTAYCLAFPGGLAVVVGGTAGAVAIKDRNVAVAKITADTGSAPGLAAPAGPVPVVVQQPSGQPVPVEAQP